MSKELIRLQDLTMEFDGERILDGINLYFNDHEFLTLLGPSGCGKTTTLRIIGGFLTPTSGTVTFDGKVINDVPPYKRQINTVFQRYALFPHLDVYDNVAFGLKVAKLPKDEVDRRVNEMLEIVSLKGYENRSVDSLSGGQQQRVAIARALVNQPKVLLLDEPLAALDLRLRKDMQIELKRIQQTTGITFIYVTHDQEEALSMSDTVVVMDKGRIQQIGRPEDIYNEPKNAFVADFIGESNILDGVMLEDFKVRFFGRVFECVDKGFAPNEPVDVVIRPEDIDIVKPAESHLVGTVTGITFKGLNYDIIVEFKGFKWLIQTTDYHGVGETIGIVVGPDRATLKDLRDQIKIDYTEQTPAVTIDDGINSVGGPMFPEKGSNVMCELFCEKGRPMEEVFAEADEIFEETLTTPYQEHVHLETNSAIADYEDGKFVFYASAQCPFYIRKSIAGLLDVPYDDIIIRQCTTGGGGGGARALTGGGFGGGGDWGKAQSPSLFLDAAGEKENSRGAEKK